ncbi:uncharacterized protein BJ212DRAFT_1293731 [Suillus subaureus]|uniref:Uncharacterized protein n=1 Tax=Suillus subaureus TaxID=48587 RepID=A0A9P7DG86_9AGAM|nr:uncharacterized protein BJ212DRAFT_1293731 [Suillus subaureus]KAG1791644.1 hypothetical protein BJ212DRAFT_1293731 [Suillus subaureus]
MDTVDPDDVLGNASFKPTVANPLPPTVDEMKAICEWLINDLKAKSIITIAFLPLSNSLFQPVIRWLLVMPRRS